jgi:hypothetical protein
MRLGGHRSKVKLMALDSEERKAITVSKDSLK